MKHLRSQGRLVSSVPYGFVLQDDGKTLAAVENEQDTIGLIHRLRDDGLTLRAIADELASREIRTKTGRDRWAPKVLADLLRDRPPVIEESRHG